MATLAHTPLKTGLSITGNVDFPRKMQPLFRPKRYKILKSGRGCAKSWSIARALLLMAARKTVRILCTREYQTSITESVHQLLSQQIELLGLSSLYEITQRVIRCHRTGSAFIFAGIKTDPKKIKSTEGIDICWVEEAEKVSEESWKFLIPTIRKDGSEIWVSFNPDQEDDPTSKRFIANLPPDSIVIELTQANNPWFSDTMRKEMEYDYRVDAEAAAHVWGGQFRKGSNAQIFRGKYIVQAFKPEATWDGPYFGADWGFANDPNTLVKLWMNQRKLYIEYEAYGVGVELNQIPQLWDSVPGARDHVIRADNSRPETIFHVGQLGFNVVAANKWPGSVEDGIVWLRHLEQIVIHTRCKHAEEEARLYRYKTDKITGDVLPIVIDAHNHIWDPVRYAMEPAINVPESEDTMIYEEQISISPELDEFELRQGL
jgi:phage terminase large subunit